MSILQHIKLSYSREAQIFKGGTIYIPGLPMATGLLLTHGDIQALAAALPPEPAPAHLPAPEQSPPPQAALRNLCCMAYANGISWYGYQSGKSTIADMAASGYFDSAGGLLKQGDLVYLQAADGCALRAVMLAPGAGLGADVRVRLVALS